MSEETKWIKIKIFTSTWHIWKQNIPIYNNYDRELGATIEVEEFEPSEDQYPSMKFISQPHGFSLGDGQSYELIAIVPSEAKEKIMELWRKIWREGINDLDLAREMLDIIYEYDDSPVVNIHIDEYETKIEIN